MRDTTLEALLYYAQQVEASVRVGRHCPFPFQPFGVHVPQETDLGRFLSCCVTLDNAFYLYIFSPLWQNEMQAQAFYLCRTVQVTDTSHEKVDDGPESWSGPFPCLSIIHCIQAQDTIDPARPFTTSSMGAG
jgi:hypothetical protein